MGRIVSTFFMSLDGVVEAPDQWHYDLFSEEMGAAIQADTEEQTAYLMGRRLYEEWYGHWREQPDTEPFAEFINRVPKHVVSTTVSTSDWAGTTFVPAGPGTDLAAEIQAIKDATDGDIGMFGSAELVRWLLAHELVDELVFFVHPVAVGRTGRLFADGSITPLELLSSEPIAHGVLHLRYRPRAASTTA